MNHFGPETEERLRRQAEREGKEAESSLSASAQQMKESSVRGPLDEWIALLHQPPPVAPPGPEGPMTREDLRRESLYED